MDLNQIVVKQISLPPSVKGLFVEAKSSRVIFVNNEISGKDMQDVVNSIFKKIALDEA